MKSVTANPYCSEAAAKDAMEAVWDVCYNDTQPFDRAPWNTVTGTCIEDSGLLGETLLFSHFYWQMIYFSNKIHFIQEISSKFSFRWLHEEILLFQIVIQTVHQWLTLFFVLHFKRIRIPLLALPSAQEKFIFFLLLTWVLKWQEDECSVRFIFCKSWFHSSYSSIIC